jgi:hypothetical protein
MWARLYIWWLREVGWIILLRMMKIIRRISWDFLKIWNRTRICMGRMLDARRMTWSAEMATIQEQEMDDRSKTEGWLRNRTGHLKIPFRSWLPSLQASANVIQPSCWPCLGSIQFSFPSLPMIHALICVRSETKISMSYMQRIFTGRLIVCETSCRCLKFGVTSSGGGTAGFIAICLLSKRRFRGPR